MNSSDPLLRFDYTVFLNDCSEVSRYKDSYVTIIYAGNADRLANLASCSVSFAGISYSVINNLKQNFDLHFFLKPWHLVRARMEHLLEVRLGFKKKQMDIIIEALQALHEFGALPVEISSVDEGSRVRSKQPCVVLKTRNHFYWLRVQLANIISAELNFWQEYTLATTAYKKAAMTWYSRLCGSKSDYTRSIIESNSYAHIFPEMSDRISTIWISQMRYTYNLNADNCVKSLYRNAEDTSSRSIPFSTSIGGLADTYRDMSLVIPYSTWCSYDFEGDFLGITELLRERSEKGLILGLHCGDSSNHKKYLEDVYKRFKGPDTTKRYKTLHPGLKLVFGGIRTLSGLNSVFQDIHLAGFSADSVLLEVTDLSLNSITDDDMTSLKREVSFTHNHHPSRIKKGDKEVINNMKPRFNHGIVYRQFISDVKTNLIQNL